ncbi:MAG: hypothetical protein MZU91_00530 [Desulfosudis oleivorans]|nr:hypothetical protein [Desulfosudis oleivorans]
MLDKSDFYILTKTLESRGYVAEQAEQPRRSVTYDDLVDVIFNEYAKK